jgi:DNA polymerase III subunit delta'
MVVGPDGAMPLPWLAASLTASTVQHRAHALLLQGSADVGVLELAVVLAQTWLCESADVAGVAKLQPCGRCAACHLMQNKAHPDLLLLLTEEARLHSGWLLPMDKAANASAEAAADDKPRKKASRQIRIDEVRWVNEWAAKTSSRGRAKVVVLHPAERLNTQAANALLKTLEEPSAGVRFLLTANDAESLMPTVRSRCQRVRMAAPDADAALAWLAAQGVDDAAALLAAAGGKPLLAWDYHQGGLTAERWLQLPAAVARGDIKALADWPLPRSLEALLRLCHDLTRRAVGGAPQYFPASVLTGFKPEMVALSDWQASLMRAARADGHAWNEGLLLESLCARGAGAMQSRHGRGIDGAGAHPGRAATLVP